MIVMVRTISKIPLLLLSLLCEAACGNAPEWTPAGDKIMTSWGENLNPAEVLPEYPRPQMVRSEWSGLNGMWDYAITSESEVCPEEYDGQILVPFAVESALSGVGRKVSDTDVLWYMREFTVPRKWAGKRILLNFGAVDWKAEVFVDGQLVGEHTGGYAPFSFDITDALASGRRHELKIKVTDKTDKWFQPRGKQVSDPRTIWYTSVTGIWQTVWMEPVNPDYLKSYMAVADINEGQLHVSADAVISEEGTVFKVVLSDDGKYVAEVESSCPELTLDVPDMKLWSPDSPHLYDLEISMLRNGKEWIRLPDMQPCVPSHMQLTKKAINV